MQKAENTKRYTQQEFVFKDAFEILFFLFCMNFGKKEEEGNETNEILFRQNDEF